MRPNRSPGRGWFGTLPGMKRGLVAAGATLAVLAGAAALLPWGCGDCGSVGNVCGSDGYLHPACTLPAEVSVIPDACCQLPDGGVADVPAADGSPRNLCDAPAECRPLQPGACIPPGSTLLPDGGILLPDGGSYQANSDGGS